jgi:hypothetical protein
MDAVASKNYTNEKPSYNNSRTEQKRLQFCKLIVKVTDNKNTAWIQSPTMLSSRDENITSPR